MVRAWACIDRQAVEIAEAATYINLQTQQQRPGLQSIALPIMWLACALQEAASSSGAGQAVPDIIESLFY